MAGIVVNGEQRPLEGVPLHTNALDFLRACGLTGAKEGCAEGECGACSVLVARPAADGTDATEWTAINSCLVPAASLDGQEVVTAEGLGAPDDLHPVQHEMAVRGGSQCGYCTPGFVCSMAAEFYRADDRRPTARGRPPTTRTTATTASTSRAQRQPVPVHGIPADHGRGVRPRLPDRRRPARLTSYGDRAGRRTDPAARRRAIRGHVAAVADELVANHHVSSTCSGTPRSASYDRNLPPACATPKVDARCKIA